MKYNYIIYLRCFLSKRITIKLADIEKKISINHNSYDVQ